MPTSVKIGESTEEDEKRAAEALTAVDNGKGPTKMDTSTTDRQMVKPVVNSGLSKRWLVCRARQPDDSLRESRGTAARFAQQGDSLELTQGRSGPELGQQV